MGIFLLLGSNQGDRLAVLKEAGGMINERIGLMVQASSIYSTQAWGEVTSDEFLNQVVEVETKLTPHEVLSQALAIEAALGRRRMEKWGPRTIDIDLLYFGDTVIASKNLTVPHPQIQFRRFTLVPLAEIAPGFVHPVLGKTQQELLQACPDTLRVDRLTPIKSQL